MSFDSLKTLFASKAETDSGFAIAYAGMEIAHAIQQLGFGSDRSGYPGIGEKIAMELHDLVGAINDLAPGE